MAHRLALRGVVDTEALSPRDVNAQRMPKAMEAKTKTAAPVKSSKDKEHPPPPPPEVPEPQSTDRPDGAVYQVGKLLGKGGFAICYSGVLQSTGRKYALKIVKSSMPSKMEQKFQTELQIHSKMRQKNIVQFFRAFSYDNCTYLVLELCPNGSLMDMVKRRKGLTEPEVRFYSLQIAGAIKYMHNKGIIHRDLKMGNIFLDSRMNAKIGDFGLAALLVTGRDMQTMRRTTLCGTPNYIAPEILEKGKKGHDHMVDIWSLGIIMFAMFTSKPPFQSSTTDEIYRRARERDYEWPNSETSSKYISQEAKDLVASMLEDADQRPDPDVIVEHPFFTSGYMPSNAEMSSRLREVPPEAAEFYSAHMNSSLQQQSYRNLSELCKECGVGPWSTDKASHSQIWKEMAAEEKAGLTPLIPLAENIVYRPFDDWVKERQQSRQRQAALAAQRAAETSEDPLSGTQRIPTGLLRQPPQSFAAQQRARDRPTASLALPSRPKAAAVEAAVLAAQSSRMRPQQELTREVTREVTREPLREMPREALREMPREALREVAREPLRDIPREILREVTRETTRDLTREAMREAARDITHAREAPEATRPTRTSARTLLPTTRSAPVLPIAERAATMSSALSSSHKRHNSESIHATTLFSSSEQPVEVAGTRPDEILERLRRLQTELERALNSRSMAIISSKTVTPPHPHIVVKWVDYTNKFGLGYILNDGSVGCVLRDIPTTEGSKTALLPPAGVFIRGAEKHILRRQDPSYPDRHQPIPMTESIKFFENNGETGLSEVLVSPEQFRVQVSEDGTPGKMNPGKDIYQHRKRERIILWKKFANYMMAYGRDETSEDAEAESPLTPGERGTPAELVTFYQRFGDVGCWVFCDGHLQFNFPDHTKIVLDASGSWCHFWHLPQEAAESLASTGNIGPTALDDRATLSYPLQTLLNFQPRTSTRPARSTTTAARRRPEIEAELQGIPAANDFRRKIEFIKNVVKEWVANEGLGNSSMSRESRLRWTGFRETISTTTPQKHVWVTIGARWGDQRISTYVDPLKPWELGEEVEGTRK
ncbi:Cell cycle serine/threonine-protein kinase CDC5/MSD2 [Escovopsis weberi]|uniref:Cell cycle serine/threonine-protein kinase CDC5/MSD2 n=1 Tax=Escovopsis weberi TaxID=150374 RepID=A0A0M8N596_ESCWE|nr:Cell cycle serine/threonine-protein kinase CDC5/MSD2 [Escovopsis weberi]